MRWASPRAARDPKLSACGSSEPAVPAVANPAVANTEYWTMHVAQTQKPEGEAVYIPLATPHRVQALVEHPLRFGRAEG